MTRVVCAQNSAPSDSAAKKEISGAKVTGSDLFLKSKVRLVLLDVVVTKGMQNEPVTGLTQKDFSILEDGKAQRILSFAVHTGVSQLPSSSNSAPPPKLPPGTFVNLSSPPDSSTPNVLLYDVLDTPYENQPRALSEIVRFLKSKPPNTRMAIFVLSGRLHLLQGFTQDEGLLLEAIKRDAGKTYLSPLTTNDSGQMSSLENFSERGALSGFGAFSLDGLLHMESMDADFVAREKLDATVYALREIARFLGGLPGRKNLIWLSGWFPGGILPGESPWDTFAEATLYSSELRNVTTQLVLSQIAIYPVDVRGLETASPFSAANARSYIMPGSFARANRNEMQTLAGEHELMDVIAEDSGGRAFYNTNGLEEAIASAVNQGAHYYTLSYSPSNKNFDGALRKIRVRLAEKGYHLAYRRSYFATEEAKASAANAALALDRLEAAMQRGAPTEHELLFKVQVTPNGTPSAPSAEQLAEMKKLRAFANGTKPENVKLQHYALHFAILGQLLALPPSGNNTHSLKVEVAADAFDADNRRVAIERWLADLVLPLEQFEEIRRGACRLSQSMDVPEQAAWMRLAIRDLTSGRIGSVEFPLPVSSDSATQQK